MNYKTWGKLFGNELRRIPPGVQIALNLRGSWVYEGGYVPGTRSEITLALNTGPEIPSEQMDIFIKKYLPT